MAEKADTLAEIRRLALANGITATEIAASLAEEAKETGADASPAEQRGAETPPADSPVEKADAESTRPGTLATVMGYIGGVFLFVGIAAFIGLNWELFPSPVRVIVTLGLGVAFFIAAMVIERDGRWPRLATPGYLIAEVLQPTGFLVAFDEYGGGGDWRIAVAVTSAFVCLQALAASRLAKNLVLVFAAIFFGTSLTFTLFDLAAVDADLAGLVIGLSLSLVALGLDAGRYRWNRGLWLLIGSFIFFMSAFDLLEGETYEPVFALVAAAGIYLTVRTRDRTLLVTSTLSLLLYLGYYTAINFADSLGWPFVLMLIGLLFIGLGFMALRIDRRYLSP